MANEDTKKTSDVSNSDDLTIVKDKLLDLLSSLSNTDLAKLESMSKGDVKKGISQDENVMSYLKTVNSLLGGTSNVFNLTQEYDRVRKYEIYDDMEETVAYVSSALDIISDDATQPDEDGLVISIKSSNDKVQSLVSSMIRDFEIQEKISKWARVVAKYGDFFVEVAGDSSKGITMVNDTYYPGNLERREVNGQLVAFVDTTLTGKGTGDIRAPWEFVHFRHKGDIYKQKDAQRLSSLNNKGIQLSGSYGQSMLSPAIRVYTQLRFVENIIILSRLTNSIRRNIFLINVGQVAPESSMETVQMYASLLKKDVTLDLDKGIYDSKKNSVTYDEDIFLPVSDVKNDLRLEQVGGDVNLVEAYDLEYLRNKLFAALKIPKAYLNYEQELNSRATLIQLDIRYARSVARLQHTIIAGIVRLAKIHLAYHGIDPTNVDLDVTLSSVSSIEAEIRRQERDQNINNARSFLDVMNSLKSVVDGEEGGGFGDPGDEGAEPKESKMDMNFVAYYAMKEYLDIPEKDIQRMIPGVKLEDYHDKVSETKKDKSSREILKEHRVYYNADNTAPYPVETSLNEWKELKCKYESKLEESDKEVEEDGEVEDLSRV